MLTKHKMGNEDVKKDFDTLSFEKQLISLKDTQEGIQSLSSWCLQRRQHHKKIVASWLNVLKRAKVEHRLVLFYLANDVIQYSKRKNYEFVESWGTTLQKATPLVRDDKVKNKILRIFRIWKERQIYDEEFLTDLTGLLSVTAGKQPDLDSNDFQAKQLVNKIKQCSVLETETEVSLKLISECSLPLTDVQKLLQLLKDRRDTDDAKKDLDDGINKLEAYVCALQKELVARAALCHLLEKAKVHYAEQRGDVKVVANAYKIFGNHVRGLKRKLDELCKELPSELKSPVPSPPSPGEPVPSPGPDEDLDLPSDASNINNQFSSNDISQNFAGKGFSSFVGNADFSISSLRKNSNTENKSEEAKKIEVISSRTDTNSNMSIDIHTLLQSLIPNKPPSKSFNSLLTPPPPPPPLLPGLDLINPAETSEPPRPVLPPMNFYSNVNSSIQNTDTSTESFVRDSNTSGQWNNSWNMQRVLPVETPQSPTEQLTSPPPPPPIIPVPPPVPDVDHRQLLAPPPIPQALLKGDDVDHRRLPPLPNPVLQPQKESNRNHKVDVDHRNLISLTMGCLPPPPAPPTTPWTPRAPQSDQDYRVNEDFSTMVPPPVPLMSIPPPNRRMMVHNDNVESIDMEMSDEENMDDGNKHVDEYLRTMRLENSMARIHGQSPSFNQPPPPIHRKQENNNRSLNRMSSQNDSQNNSYVRTNLVRINSNDDLDSESTPKKSKFYNQDKDTELHQQQHHSSNSDIFSDYPNNSMNPQNPNNQQMYDQFNKSDSNWDTYDEEQSGANQEMWHNSAPPMNPSTPNFGRNKFSPRVPPMTYNRRSAPLLSTPDDQQYKPQHFRGNGKYRRPRGHHHHRPPRGGYW